MRRSCRIGRGRGARGLIAALGITLVAGVAATAQAQDWGGFTTPTAPPLNVLGTYNRGCLEGAQTLPLDGDGYQVMRLSRRRYFGHPSLIHFVETLASELRTDGYPGLLIGDMAQPRGGPMPSGHASHQVGLDVDIWLMPAPERRLSDAERESLVAPTMVAANGLGVNGAWGPPQVAALRHAAEAAEVDRIFVNAAIKKELCNSVPGDRGWLAKLRPWWGHDAHFHVRLGCPADQAGCVGQQPVPPQDSCDASLDWWFSSAARADLEKQQKAAPVRRLTLDDLPPGCLAVFTAD
ncbi:MAG: penicillin-insensitive murein endopeptidase [Rhodospirillales bacterium]